MTATFTLLPTSFSLTVTKSGTGSGTVTRAPPVISCGTTCFASFASGTTVTLTATPATGSTFAGWNGACTGTGACTVTRSSVQAVGATFGTASSGGFTDNPLVAGVVVVKATHINERRTAINAARTRNGLAAATWTDATLTPGSTAIKAVHIAELRAALNAIFTKLGKTLPSYTDATIVSGQTTAKAVHIQELRNALGVLP